MKIGYACIPMGVPYKTTRGFILKNFSSERFLEALSLNLKDLKNILKYNVENDILMFRISSDIVPFGSHNINTIKWWDVFKDELEDIGKFIIENDIRISMHPGQYTVLNSPSEDVVLKSLAEIEYHCLFLDRLGVDYKNKIILHVGGVYGDKSSAIERFKSNFDRLSESAKKRLVIENDDKSFNIEDILNICKHLNIPAVFDNLHHRCNPSSIKGLSIDLQSISAKENSSASSSIYPENSFCEISEYEDLRCILKEVEQTWKDEDGPMKLHYSDSDDSKKLGSHSKFIITDNFLKYYSIVKDFNADVMLEVKDKDISAIKCINCLKKFCKKSTIYEQWAKYKYSVMEKNYAYYKECSKLVNSDHTLIDFYKYVDSVLLNAFSAENYKNTLYHTWGYIKDCANEKERTEFNSFFQTPEDLDFNKLEKIKNFIKRLSKKYNAEYLLNSYYFIY